MRRARGDIVIRITYLSRHTLNGLQELLYELASDDHLRVGLCHRILVQPLQDKLSYPELMKFLNKQETKL